MADHDDSIPPSIEELDDIEALARRFLVAQAAPEAPLVAAGDGHQRLAEPPPDADAGSIANSNGRTTPSVEALIARRRGARDRTKPPAIHFGPGRATLARADGVPRRAIEFNGATILARPRFAPPVPKPERRNGPEAAVAGDRAPGFLIEDARAAQSPGPPPAALVAFPAQAVEPELATPEHAAAPPIEVELLEPEQPAVPIEATPTSAAAFPPRYPALRATRRVPSPHLPGVDRRAAPAAIPQPRGTGGLPAAPAPMPAISVEDMPSRPELPPQSALLVSFPALIVEPELAVPLPEPVAAPRPVPPVAREISEVARSPTPGVATPAAVEAYERQDYPAALAAWSEAAAAGNSEAQFRLGQLYARGHGVVANIGDALVWYQRAAAQGHAEAQY
jgi:hypothetical protein